MAVVTEPLLSANVGAVTDRILYVGEDEDSPYRSHRPKADFEIRRKRVSLTVDSGSLYTTILKDVLIRVSGSQIVSQGYKSRGLSKRSNHHCRIYGL